MKNSNKKTAAALLRTKAEELLRKNKLKTGSKSSETGMPKLVHELDVHKIELEMQNEELVRAKMKAEAAAEKYAELYEFAPSGYFTLSQEGVIVELNLIASNMIGKERLHCVRCSLVSFISDDTKPIFNRFLENIFISKTKESCDVTIAVNKNLPLYVTLTGIAADNGNQCFVTAIDINDRRMAEAKERENELRLKTITATFDDIMFYEYELESETNNKPRQFKYVSETINHMHGISSEALLRDPMKLYDQVNAEDAVLLLEKEKRALATMTPFSLEVRVQLPSGDIRWRQFYSTPLLKENGIVTWYGMEIDVSERKKIEEALRRKQKMESIGSLASGIAHDFNNLLGAMMGNVSLMQMQLPADHSVVKYIDQTLKIIKQAATLTKQMLAYSGKGQFQILTIDLVAAIKEQVALIKVSTPKNVELRMNLPQTPLYVNGDPGQIEQIIMNIIMNAGEAVGEKHGVVSVGVSAMMMSNKELISYSLRTTTTLNEGEYALFQVSDNGCGMSRETLEKVFDPFFTTKFVGRGLGLAAVLGIIREHKGGVAIESTEGIGTTFRVLLPIVCAPVSINDTSQKNTPPQEAKPATVLIIDDEEYIVDWVCDVLTAGKCQPLSATDPVVGVAIYKEQWHTIDVVILEYSMPKLNGKEVLIELRKINPNVKVLMASGYSEEELGHLMGDVRPIAIIQKPHSAEALLSMISKMLVMK